MPSRNTRPRCTIQLINVLGEVVPILDEGAVITPGTERTRYRESWSEEEDLAYVYRQPVPAPGGTVSNVEWQGDVHGSIGYELLLARASGKFMLRVDYFTVLPSTASGALDLTYEPRSVSLSGVLGSKAKIVVDTELQSGFSELAGRPDFRLLRITFR